MAAKVKTVLKNLEFFLHRTYDFLICVFIQKAILFCYLFYPDNHDMKNNQASFRLRDVWIYNQNLILMLKTNINMCFTFGVDIYCFKTDIKFL